MFIKILKFSFQNTFHEFHQKIRVILHCQFPVIRGKFCWILVEEINGRGLKIGCFLLFSKNQHLNAVSNLQLRNQLIFTGYLKLFKLVFLSSNKQFSSILLQAQGTSCKILIIQSYKVFWVWFCIILVIYFTNGCK